MGAAPADEKDEPAPQDTREAEGREQREPGQPTRAAPPEIDREAREIGRQQGTSQRGFTRDEG